jgi:hypothetical protein
MASAIVFLSGKDAAAGRQDPALAFTRSLGALVPAAVAGLVRDVTIAGLAGQDLGTIADHAGCGFVEAEAEADWLREALALAKGPDCLLMCAGYVPGPGFIEELRDIENRPNARGVFRAEPGSWHQRLVPRLAPVAAAIAPMDLWPAQGTQDFQRMARGLKGRTLRTRMHWVG